MHMHWLYHFMTPCHATVSVAAGCSQGSSRAISICWNALGLKEATLSDTVHTSTFQSIFSALFYHPPSVQQQPSCCPAPFWPPERSCRVNYPFMDRLTSGQRLHFLTMMAVSTNQARLISFFHPSRALSPSSMRKTVQVLTHFLILDP